MNDRNHIIYRLFTAEARGAEARRKIGRFQIRGLSIGHVRASLDSHATWFSACLCLSAVKAGAALLRASNLFIGSQLGVHLDLPGATRMSEAVYS